MIAPKVPRLSPAQSKRNFAAVAERSKGVCEHCGLRPATQKHHRKFKSRGGRDDVVNLLDLCGSGNMLGCHGAAHSGGSAAEDLGLSVASSNDPAVMSVVYRGVRCFLRENGDVVPC